MPDPFRLFRAFRQAHPTLSQVQLWSTLNNYLLPSEEALSRSSINRLCAENVRSHRVITRANTLINRHIEVNKDFDPDLATETMPLVRRRYSERSERLPDINSGVWLVVHYATTRANVDDQNIPWKYRTAILVYGGPRPRRSGFTLFGYSTIFEGSVSFLNQHLYYQSFETQRAQERAFMIAKQVFQRHDDVWQHEGIMMGVAISGYGANPMHVYATRMLARKVDTLSADPAGCERLFRSSDEARRVWCNYFDDRSFAKLARIEPATREVRAFQRSAIVEFKKRAKVRENSFEEAVRMFMP